MTFPVAAIVKLGQLALQFGRVNRVTFHEDGLRPETDTDHTVMLGLVACAFAAEVNRERIAYFEEWRRKVGKAISDTKTEERPRLLDIDKIARFSLVHDFVEVHSGDVDSLNLSAAGAQAKEDAEKVALWRLKEELKDLPWVCAAIDDYNSLRTPEARFVKVLDKALPKITVILNGCAGLRGRAKLEDVDAINQRQIEKLRASYGADQPEAMALLEAVCAELKAAIEKLPPRVKPEDCRPGCSTCDDYLTRPSDQCGCVRCHKELQATNEKLPKRCAACNGSGEDRLKPRISDGGHGFYPDCTACKVAQ